MQVNTSIACLLALIILTGCEASPPPRAYQVKGRLIVDDKLAAKACIAFHPVDMQKSQGRCPVAMTRQDGSFELTTYAMDDGAPEGDYTVTVTWPNESMPVDECECPNPLEHDRLGGMYADPRKTSLLVTVLPRDNHVNLTAKAVRRPKSTSRAHPTSVQIP